jgi:hypothetical protein
MNGLATTMMTMTTLLLIGTSQLDKHQQKEYLHMLKQCLIKKTSRKLWSVAVQGLGNGR